jgi:hypothetical protein
VAKFISKVFAHLQENKVFHKFQEYLLDVDGMPEPWREANAIDDLLGQAFAIGEQDCSSTPRHPWSENLHKASQKVRYWKAFITAKSTGVNQSDVLDALAADIWPDGPPLSPSNRYVLRKVKIAAKRALKRVQRDSANERKTFLQELRRRGPCRPEDLAVKNVEKQLQDNRRFSRIARTLKSNSSPALTKVEIISTREHIHPVTGKRHTFTDTTTVDIHKELETAIINRSQRHFAQAESTPLTVPLLRFINSYKEFNVCKDAADNDVVLLDDAFVETATVLAILQERAQNPTTEWAPEVDFDNFLSGLLHWRETTSTLPSSRHLGLYKALATAYCNSNDEFANPANSNDPFDIPTQEKAYQILHLIHGLATTAATCGFYL